MKFRAPAYVKVRKDHGWFVNTGKVGARLIGARTLGRQFVGTMTGLADAARKTRRRSMITWAIGVCAASLVFFAPAALAAPSQSSAASARSKHKLSHRNAHRMLGRSGGRVRARGGAQIYVPPGTIRGRGRVSITYRPGGRIDFHIQAAWQGNVAVTMPHVRRSEVVVHDIAGTFLPEGRPGQRTVWVSQLSVLDKAKAKAKAAACFLTLSKKKLVLCLSQKLGNKVSKEVGQWIADKLGGSCTATLIASGVFAGPGGIFISNFTDPACGGELENDGFTYPSGPSGSTLPVTTNSGSSQLPTVKPQRPTANPPAPASPPAPPAPPANRAPVITSVSPASGAIVGSTTPRLDVVAHDDDGEPLQHAYRLTGPSTDLSSGWVDGAWTVPDHKLDPGSRYDWTVSVRDPRGATATWKSWLRIAMLPTATELVSLSTGDGYWQVASDGGVFSYGSAQFYGSLPGINVHVTNIMGMARTPDDKGYWLVGSDGGVFAFGDAPFAGSLPGQNIHVNNIVGMAPTKDGRGYWLVGSDGGVFSFGTAQFYGSMGGQHLNAPVARMAPTASGNGYWLVARDGGVFAFGDAPFYGSMGSQHLNAPVIDIDVAPDGSGYWLTAEDGGVFTYGTAQYYGSLADLHLNGHITSMSLTADTGGYWLNGCDGGVFSFGNAVFYGSNPTYHCRGT